MNRHGKFTPPGYITRLSMCEILVFWSNLEGQHYDAMARIAHKNFGAEWGVGDGPTGKCYAIPTMHGRIDDIKPYVDKFLQYAKDHPMNRFIVSRIVRGTAGCSDKDIAPLFLEALIIPNIVIPVKWAFTYIDLGLNPNEAYGIFQEPKAPAVITESLLHELTKKYAYPISNKLYRYIPPVGVRYVIDNNEFGYTTLANCFFFEDGGMYVWDTDEKWKEDHNQAVVECFYGDECIGRGYAHRVIFAGVATGVKDINGEMIYTGDIIHIGDGECGYDFALGAFKDNYLFLLDNHALLLADCMDKPLKRIGTVFYQLDWNEYPVTVNERTMRFQGWRDTTQQQNLKKLMARFTPNFDQEEWKYEALDIIGAEYHWNK